jgi:hypothetical protein
MEGISFSVMLFDFLVCNEKGKEESKLCPFVTFLCRHYRVLLSTFLFVWRGLVRLVTGTTVRDS